MVFLNCKDLPRQTRGFYKREFSLIKKILLVILVSIASSAYAQSFNKVAPAFAVPYLLIDGSKVDQGVVDGAVNRKNLKKFNDKVDKIVLPAGYVLAAYEHVNYKGASRLFYGTMKIGGYLKGKISSIKIRKYSELNCATAYQHSGYSGDAWPFCMVDGKPVITDVKYWKNKISSVSVSAGTRVSFCGDISDTPCRSYTSSKRNIRSASNDQFDRVLLTKFDDSSFQMLFVSDPQFGWDGTKPNELAIYSSDYTGDPEDSWEKSVERQVASMLPIRMPLANPKYAGMVLNGDVTNTGKARQLKKFDKLFQGLFDNIYVGLGNHDYDNYLKSRDNEDVFEWYERTISGLPGLLSYDIDGPRDSSGARDKYSGSLAYSWDIGDVHFIQLNNYPSYRVQGDYDVEFDIRDSLGWLESDLREHGQGKRIVINMHALSVSAFRSQGCSPPCDTLGDIPANQPLDADGNPKPLSESQRSSNTVADYQEFQRVLDIARQGAKDHVVLVFAGHIHSWAGSAQDFYVDRSPQPSRAANPPGQTILTSAGESIPIFFCGGAQYSKHLIVDFESDSIVVKTIDSRFGIADLRQTATVTNLAPSLVTTTTP